MASHRKATRALTNPRCSHGRPHAWNVSTRCKPSTAEMCEALRFCCSTLLESCVSIHESASNATGALPSVPLRQLLPSGPSGTLLSIRRLPLLHAGAATSCTPSPTRRATCSPSGRRSPRQAAGAPPTCSPTRMRTGGGPAFRCAEPAGHAPQSRPIGHWAPSCRTFGPGVASVCACAACLRAPSSKRATTADLLSPLVGP